MYIVMIASECAPVSKVGGLADVVDGLSRELANKGHKVEVILPDYDCMNHSIAGNLQNNPTEISVPCSGKQILSTVHRAVVHGNECFFIKTYSQERYFDRGVYYGDGDDDERFTVFCLSAVEFLLNTGKRPDIIHCHDWQTAIIPALLKTKHRQSTLSETKTCYTIHNICHQGKTSEKILKLAGFEPPFFTGGDTMADDSGSACINLMKGGIIYSDAITTVSPKYAAETMTDQMGGGMQKTLSKYSGKYTGIINGIDYDSWSPGTDKCIPFNYGIESIDAKYKNKEHLRRELSLKQDFKPIVSVVGRLDMQKGVHLIRHSLLYALDNGIQFVLLGSSPDTEIDIYFHHLKHYLKSNHNCHIRLGYDEELTHLIYAGSDMILIPSLFEPCGLTQMIAMRYGTVPVVRNTGGLSDTVFDARTSVNSITERNGFLFDDFSYDAVELALRRASVMWYEKPHSFREIMLTGMKADYSWRSSADKYLSLYNKISGRW
ncbi:MAG: glycogen synthase [Nitrospirae bacterium]|nr:glycogen synthase [Nitrospirota bacterium]